MNQVIPNYTLLQIYNQALEKIQFRWKIFSNAYFPIYNWFYGKKIIQYKPDKQYSYYKFVNIRQAYLI